MANSKVHGRFVWYELMTSNPDAAQKFYTQAIGWTTQKFDGPMEYTMWVAPSGPVGGVMQLPEEAKKMGAPPHWLAYIGTDNVDATVKRARELSAKVLVEAKDIPNVGRFAVLQDPQGAVFAAFKGTKEEPVREGALGEFAWHELYTTDAVAALTFYTDLFGWEKTTAMDMGPMGVYQMYGQGEKTYGGIMKITPDMKGMPPNWNLYVRVDNADHAVNRIRELGGKIMNGPMDVPGPSGERIAQAIDPQGAAFSVVGPLKK